MYQRELKKRSSSREIINEIVLDEAPNQYYNNHHIISVRMQLVHSSINTVKSSFSLMTHSASRQKRNQ